MVKSASPISEPTQPYHDSGLQRLDLPASSKLIIELSNTIPFEFLLRTQHNLRLNESVLLTEEKNTLGVVVYFSHHCTHTQGYTFNYCMQEPDLF